MKRIGDRGFLYAWQTIRSTYESNPETMGWNLDDAACRRTRVSHALAEFSVVQDVHHVVHATGRGSWGFIVVSETWWDHSHRVIRSQHWATPLHGATSAMQEWVARHAENLRERSMQSPPTKPRLR